MEHYIPGLSFIVTVGIFIFFYLDARHRNAWFTKALHRWQAAIGMLLGFASLALSVHLNFLSNQRAEELKLQQASKNLALGLYVEVASLFNQAQWHQSSIQEVADELEDTQRIKKQLCEDWISAVDTWRLQSNGFFEVNRANLGILPSELAYVFSLLHERVAAHGRRLDEFKLAKCGPAAASPARLLYFETDLIKVRVNFIASRLNKLGIDVPQPEDLPKL